MSSFQPSPGGRGVCSENPDESRAVHAGASFASCIAAASRAPLTPGKDLGFASRKKQRGRVSSQLRPWCAGRRGGKAGGRRSAQCSVPSADTLAAGRAAECRRSSRGSPCRVLSVRMRRDVGWRLCAEGVGRRGGFGGRRFGLWRALALVRRAVPAAFGAVRRRCPLQRIPASHA